MNYSTHRLSLDLHDTSSCHIIYCKKGDTARQIAIDLNESGVPYIIAEDCSAVLVGTKPDKNGLYQVCEIKNNVIYYKFNEQTAPVVGQVDCEIRLYGSNKELITSAGFAIVVEDVEYTDGEIIDSETDFSGLGSLITLSGAEATIDDSVGTPSVEAKLSGPPNERKLSFAFTGIKGERGFTGPQGDTGPQGEQGPQGEKGDTYTLTEYDKKEIGDSVNAVRYESQSLTEDQKAQARQNIGAASDIVYLATDYGISTEATDNAPALQTLIDMVSESGGGIIFFPVGTYNFMRWGTPDHRWAVEMKSNVSIIGENMETTVLKQTQKAYAYSLFGRILDNRGGATDPLTGCTFQNFTVDGYGSSDENAVWGKAFFFQYVKDCVFRDLRLIGTNATALGIDFLDGVVIDNVHCIDCGRTFTGTEAGTSGIGIGTAGWENENFIITNCICEGSGQYGIFIENQGIFYEGNVPYAKGCIISNCIVRNGINKGIGVRGGQNVTVIGCESYENTSHGIYIDNNCKNVKVISCSSANNGGSGICIEPSKTEHLLIKGCTFVNNKAEGIKVSVGAGKNANKLSIQDCYTDGNTIGIDLSANNLSDCVILGNATLDGINNNTTFTGNTSFNDLLNVDTPDTPTETIIAVPFSSLTNGKKLMPDGSLANGTNNSNFATEEYIDVSALNDTFGIFYPTAGVGASRGNIRTAQYDSNKNSLGDSFGLPRADETIGEHDVWKVTKLEGCRYIRLFLNGGFNNVDGELRNLDGV